MEALNGAAATAEKYGEPLPADADEVPGCRAEAESAVFGDRDKEPIPAEFNPLREEMDTLWDRILRDPRVEEAASVWADCMSDAGHSGFEHPDDARADVIRRQWELYGLEPPEDLLHPDPGSRRSLGPMPVGPPRGASSEPDAAALAELQDDEIALAVADRRCRPAYQEVVNDVQDEIEQAFIDDHREELERWLQSIGLADESG
jgi:hypothetical protein